MDKISVKVLRDLANNPSIIEIMKNNRKVTATFDPNIGLVLEGPSGLLPRIAEILQMAYPFEMPSFARPAWYDRNPKSVGQEYDASVAGHAAATRITYTVPEDRKCIVECLSINASRDGAAGGNNWINVRRVHTPYGEAATRIQTVTKFGNTVGDVIHWTLGGTLTLFAGDMIEMTTSDLINAGGSVSYECGFKGTEFDA